jgi:hypothetical protein
MGEEKMGIVDFTEVRGYHFDKRDGKEDVVFCLDCAIDKEKITDHEVKEKNLIFPDEDDIFEIYYCDRCGKRMTLIGEPWPSRIKPNTLINVKKKSQKKKS